MEQLILLLGFTMMWSAVHFNRNKRDSTLPFLSLRWWYVAIILFISIMIVKYSSEITQIIMS